MEVILKDMDKMSISKPWKSANTNSMDFLYSIDSWAQDCRNSIANALESL